MKVNFTPSMRSFLKSKGYTHIFNEGIIGDSDNYLLIPLKPGDQRFQDEEASKRIDVISSQETSDMAGGDEFINFLVQVSSEELEQYQITLT